MSIDDTSTTDNNKLLQYRLADIEKKLDTILEQLDLSLKSNARLRADLAKTLPEVIEAAGRIQ